MTPQQILFIALSAITLGGALLVVTRRHILHAALFLTLSFFGVVGLYVLLEAPLLAGVQLAAVLLVAFAIRRTRGLLSRQQSQATRQWWAAATVALLLCATLGWIILGHDWGRSAEPVSENSIALLGAALIDPSGFVLPFVLVPIVLFSALIGVVTIARER
ncbi:MAG: NADH-quinone oxidoreductase subunit J [Chloroflexota bacterium]|nr:NADH-quinone oxidoreductase subunit J [Chloroflexota bacterium]